MATPPPPPKKYIVFERRQRCTCCGSYHSWSEVYQFSALPTRLGFGKDIPNMHRTFHFKYNIPIEQRPPHSVELVPACHSCYQPTLAHTPGLLEPPTVEDTKQVMGLTTKSPLPAKPAPAPKEKRPPATTSELLELLA